jgi:autotransporter-associated beta strand protein
MKLHQKLLVTTALTGLMVSGGALLSASGTYAQDIFIDGTQYSSPLTLTQTLSNFTDIISGGVGDALIQSANPNAANPFALSTNNDVSIDVLGPGQLTISSPIIANAFPRLYITINDSGGDGTLILSGDNDLADATLIVRDGTLSFQNSASLGNAFLELRGDGTIDFADGFNAGNFSILEVFSGHLNQSQGTATFGGLLTNNGVANANYKKTGAGTLILSGNNSTYSALVRVNDGTLGATNNNSFGTGQVTLIRGGLLLADGLTIANAIASNAQPSSIDVETGDTATLTGVISGNSGLTKIGAGTLTLSGNNTYTAATTVTAGTLALSGSNQSTLYQVDAGATLQGLTGVDVFDTATLTINGTYDVDASDTIGSVSGTGAIDIATGQTLNTGGDDTSTTFSGTVSGDGALTKSGTGTFTLSGNNSYTGGTNVAGGTLALGHSNAAGTGTITTTGSVIDYADGIDVSNAININSDTTQLQVTTGSATQSGVISETTGPRPLEKVGNGMLTLSGNNTYTGATTVTTGTLALSGSNQSTSYQVDSGATLQGITGVDILDTSALTINGAYDVDASDTIGLVSGTGSIDIASSQILTTGAANSSSTFSGTVSGGGGLTKVGTGTFNLSGNNTYTGTTTVNGGTIALSGSNASTSYTIASGATLQTLAGADISDTASIDVAGTFDVDASDTIGSVTGAGSIDIATGQTLTTGAANTDTTFSGAISGDGALTKSGTGTFTLSGNNGHTGGTNVNGGTLAVTSTFGGNFDVNSSGILDITGTLTGTTNVNSGGILKGTGTLADVNLLSGGILAPGASIGTINTGDLTLNSGSTLEIEVDDTGASDLVNVSGTVSLGGSTLDIKGAAGTYAGAPYDYTIMDNDNADAVTGAFGTITDDLAFLEASVDYTGGDGNDVVLTLTELASFVIAGTPQNQQNVGNALGNVDRTSGSEGEALMQQIVRLTNDEARQTYKDLSGDIHPSNTHTMFDVGGNVGGQIGGRFTNLSGSGIGAGSNGFGYHAALETLNSNSTNSSYFSSDLATQNEVSGSQEFGYGYTPVSSDETLQLWGGISGYYANVESDGNAQGTVSSGFGAVFGGDRTIGSQTWGAAFGYAKTTTITNDSLSELAMNSFSGAIYTHQEIGDFNLNALAAYTYHQIDSKRTISNINATALTDYFAHQFTLQSEISRTIAYDHNKDITPYILGRYMNLSTSAYTETGAGAANLVSNGENFWSLDLVLGARMDVELNEDTKISFGGGYSYRFGDNQPETTQSFSGGGTFTTTGVARNRHSAFLEAGIEKAFLDNATFFAKANAELTDTHQSIGGNIGFKVRF